MENENMVEQETLTPAEESSDSNTEETAETAEETTEEVDWKSEAERAKQLAQNYKVRAEKAEKKAKEFTPKETPKEQKDEISMSDFYALNKANVHEDDIQEVRDYAKLKGLSIKDALKSTLIKALLSEREEERKTAQATSVKITRRSTTAISDETILKQAEKGELPEEKDIESLAEARLQEKLKSRGLSK